MGHIMHMISGPASGFKKHTKPNCCFNGEHADKPWGFNGFWVPKFQTNPYIIIGGLSNAM